MILGVGVLAYFKGIDGFSKLSAYYTIQKESIEQKARADDDVRNCLERIRNFKLSEDYYERKNDPNYNTLNIESLLTKLKSRRTICLKGNYGI